MREIRISGSTRGERGAALRLSLSLLLYGSDWNAATGVPSGPGAISHYGEPRPPFSSRSIALANSPGV